MIFCTLGLQVCLPNSPLQDRRYCAPISRQTSICIGGVFSGSNFQVHFAVKLNHNTLRDFDWSQTYALVSPKRDNDDCLIRKLVVAFNNATHAQSIWLSISPCSEQLITKTMIAKVILRCSIDIRNVDSDMVEWFHYGDALCVSLCRRPHQLLRLRKEP